MPANAASQPRMRSSSMACPTDSWICRASCSPPRISVGLAGRAERRGEQRPGLLGDPRGVRRPGRATSTSSQPRGAVLPAVARLGAALRLAVADRRWPRCRAPHSRMCWSMRWPSLETNHLRGVPDLVEALGQVGAVLAPSCGSRRPAGRPCPTAAPRAGRSAQPEAQLAVTGLGRHQVDRRARHPRARHGDPRRRAGRRRGRRRRTGRVRRRSPSSTRPARGRRCPTLSSWVSSSTSPLRAVIDS